MLALVAAALSLTSPAFHAGGTIPRTYTCDGRGYSPPLRWTAPPRGTRYFALSVSDPDARGFVHWLAWDIPASSRGLRAGQHPAVEGTNGFGRRGWTGPCPPSGTHRYVFALYALGEPLRLARGAGKQAFFGRLARVQITARASLSARYTRQ